MTNTNIIKGLTILSKGREDQYDVCAEHDQIYAGPEAEDVSPEDVSPEDAKQLKDLGWFISSDCGRWSAFV